MPSVGVDVGLTDPRSWFRLAMQAGRMAIWADDPLTQIVVNAVILVVAMLSSSVGFVPGLVIAFVAFWLIVIGLARLTVGVLR